MPEAAPPAEAPAAPQSPATRPGEVRRGPPESAVEAPKTETKAPEPDRLAELAKQTKLIASERMKLGHESRKAREEIAKQQADLADQRKELDAWKLERADRRRNPSKYLQAEYGDDWYEKLSHVKLNGSPTPDLIASEVDDQVAILRKELGETKAEFAKRLEERDAQETERAMQEYQQSAITYIQSNAEKYPLVHAFGVSQNINAVIQNHFNETTKPNDAGEMQPGELLTPEQAAGIMERWVQEKLDAVEKAKALKQPAKAPSPAAPDKRIESPQRRSLSTDMTGTSQSEKPPARNDAERFKRAIAAMEAAEQQH